MKGSVIPLCSICGKKKSRFLWGTHNNERMIFCSLKCATAYAIDTYPSMQWCVGHQKWFHENQSCTECDNKVDAKYKVRFNRKKEASP
jgi:hypothetical protein